MDARLNAQVIRIAVELATRHGYRFQPAKATFCDGTEGYSVELSTDRGRYSGWQKVITFYNDDTFGPRWIGLAGCTVPADLVTTYVDTFAVDPRIHPQDLHWKVFGR